jgi:hypothetical protein
MQDTIELRMEKCKFDAVNGELRMMQDTMIYDADFKDLRRFPSSGFGEKYRYHEHRNCGFGKYNRTHENSEQSYGKIINLRHSNSQTICFEI